MQYVIVINDGPEEYLIYGPFKSETAAHHFINPLDDDGVPKGTDVNYNVVELTNPEDANV